MRPSKADLNVRPILTFASFVTSHLVNDPRVRMSVALALSDLFSVAASWLVAIALRAAFGSFSPQTYISLTPVASVFIAAYALRSLYPATGMGPTEELRRRPDLSWLLSRLTPECSSRRATPGLWPMPSCGWRATRTNGRRWEHPPGPIASRTTAATPFLGNSRRS